MATPGGDDIATITRLLASADFDSAHDDEQQDKIYEAEDMLFDQSVRADLADGLAYGAANACTTDNSYERVLSLLLTALVVEAQCLQGETTETTNRLSEALCHLIVKHGTSSSSDLNLTAKASDFLTSVLSGPDDEAHEEGEEPPAPKHMQASSISESLLSIARAPVKNDNRGLYGPGLVLAHAAHCAAPPPADEDEGKWNSSKETSADAYRRDLIDLLGRRVFALGGAAAPATVAEVELCHNLIVGVTKEEFDGAILRPLKFKLMAAPEPTMETLAAFISILTDSGNGNYIESHLAGGTNLVLAALRQVKNAKPKPRADGANVMGEIARASPGRGATMATEKLVEAVGEVGPGPDAGGLYTALMNVALSLLESKAGQAAEGLANDVAIPCLENAVQNGEGGDATDALRAWMEVGGRDPSSIPVAPVAAAAGVAVGTAAAASHQPPESIDRMEQDVLAKNRGRAPGGVPASRPGAQAMGRDEASRLDDRIAAKQHASSAAGASQQSREEAERRRQRENAKAAAAGLAAGAAVGAGMAAANSDDRPPANVNSLEDDILAKNRARGGKSQPANAPGAMSVDALDERINAKTRAEPTRPRNPEDDVLPGAHMGNEEDAANTNRKIFVAGAAATAAPEPTLKDEQAKVDEFAPPTETSIDQKAMLTHGVMKDELLEDAPDGSSHEPSSSAAAPPPMGGESDRFVDEHTLRQNPNDPRSHAVESRGVTNEPDVEYGQMTPGDQGDHGVDRGIVSEPGVEYGNRGPEGEDGGGLAVAVAVSPEEEEAFIPAAIEYDPDSKPPLYKNRRFRLYAVGGVILLVILVIGITVGVTKSVSDDKQAGTGNEVKVEVIATDQPTEQPTAKPTKQSLSSLCEELGGCPAPTPAAQPTASAPTTTPAEGHAYAKALQWMLEEDPLTQQWLAADSDEKDNMMQVDVSQRIRLVEFYFSTTTEDSFWNHCGYNGDPEEVDCYVPGTSESGQAIEELEYSWLSKQHECDWYGVYCGEDNKTRLLLITDNNLNGTLPVHLYELKEMQFIGLYLNELTGTIPTEYGLMKHLINIELHYNNLYGEVPEEIYMAEALQRVNFGDNWLDGTISTMIGELPSLKGVFYFDNLFDGEFPSEIGKLEYLAFTRNHGNAFTGTIPTEIGNLEKVREFWLYGCLFNGTIPTEIGGMKDLETFRLQEQSLTGPLPDSLYDLAQLRQLYIFTNSLNGTISTEVGRLTNAERLVYRKNEFSGPIPTEFAKLSKLEYLWLHYNDFTGPVPDDICDLRTQKLRFLNADCMEANETGPITNDCQCCTTCCDNVREVCFKMN